MPKRWPRSLAAIGLIITGVCVASAASLGGLGAAGLLGLSQNGSSGSPSVIGCDNFTGTTGVSMNGRTVTVAGNCSSRTWTAHVGTWTIQSNMAASSATANAAATLNTTTVDSTTSVVLSNLNTSARSGGLIISHNGTSTYLAAVMIDGTPDRIELRLYSSGTPTVLATYFPTFATTNTLQLARAANTVTTTLNGVASGSLALSAAQQTTLSSGARAGLFGGNSSVRFDDFVITAP